MSRYKVVGRQGKTDFFNDLYAARRKRDNKWAGNAKIYEEQSDKTWVEIR